MKIKAKGLRLAALLLTVSMMVGVLTVMPISVSAYSKSDSAAVGTGTEVPSTIPVYDGTPSIALEQKDDGTYQINSVADFVYFHETAATLATADDVFELNCDIALNDANYGTTGSHTSLTPLIPFAGTLDGNGHSIYNMYSYVGKNGALFGELTGTVQNLTLVSPRITNSSTNNADRASVVADSCSGTIKNITVEDAYVYSRRASGIVHTALDGAVITSCTVSGVISAVVDATGIACARTSTKSSPAYITNCINYASVTTTGGAASGILGQDRSNATTSGYVISGCVNYGDITATGSAGGILAASYRTGVVTDITYCVNYGKIKSTGSGACAGGIAGAMPDYGSNKQHQHANIIGCINYGDVESSQIAGGMVAVSDPTGVTTTIQDCANYGNVVGTTYAGGMVGKLLADHSHAAGKLVVNNSANYGNVTADVVGGVIGYFVAHYNNSATLNVKGYVSVCDLIGTTQASPVCGAFEFEYQNAATNQDIVIDSMWYRGHVSVGEDGTAAAVVAVTTTEKTLVAGTPTIIITNSGFDATFSVAGAEISAVTAYDADGTARTGYSNGTDAITDAYPVAASESFAANALSKLNTFAGTTYKNWKADETYLLVHITEALALANEDSLNHKYTSKTIDAAYVVFDANIKTVEVTYYLTSDLSTPLDGTPTRPGDYRVILQGKTATGENYGDPVSCDYSISKGDVSFKLTAESLTGFKKENNYNSAIIEKHSTTFTGNEFTFEAIAYDVTDGIVGEDVQAGIKSTKYTTTAWNEPLLDNVLHVNSYYVHFTFDGNDLYEATKGKFLIVINAATFTYPAADAEGRWNIPSFTGTEQQVTLNFLEGEIPASLFDITYGGEYTATYMADGETKNATATLTLKEEFASDCTFTDDAPTYTVDWHMDTVIYISGATMSLGSNMALNIKLNADEVALFGNNLSVAIVNGDGDGIIATLDEYNRFSASFDGLRAADMAQDLQLHIVVTTEDGKSYTSTNILTYSPLTYLTNLYADYTGEKQGEANATKVLNVVTAMLGYGAAAETKDSGATTIAAKMSELKITAPTFTEGYTDHISGVVTEDDKTAINNIAQVGATLTGGMELTFTMKNTAYTALSIADFGVFYADENGKITVTGINAAMILDTLSLTFTGDGVDGVSANFTVGDFLESRRDNADETALAEATILYMMAARAYVLN